MRLTPKSELAARCAKLQALMAGEGLDAVIMLQNADLFYFAGTIQAGNLYVPAQGDPIYLVRRDFQRAVRESALEEIIPFSSMREIPDIISRKGCQRPNRIGMECDVLPVALYDRFRKAFPEADFCDASTLIRQVRMVKSPYEISIMREAAQQVDAVFRRVCQVAGEGMSELELDAELEKIARLAGHPGLIRMRVFNGEMMFGHTLSGADSAVPAYTDTPLGGVGLTPAFGQGAGNRRIAAHEPLVIDFSGSVDGYLVDQTRLFAVGGLPDRLREGYLAMLSVQERMTDLAKPGAAWSDIYGECLGLAVKLGYGDYFMGYKGAQVSFIGHGIGVEIDEYPFLARGFSDRVMEAGMTFAFEPKLVFPGLGSVGIENTFYLSEDGLEKLTFSSEEIVIL